MPNSNALNARVEWETAQHLQRLVHKNDELTAAAGAYAGPLQGGGVESHTDAH